MTEAATSVLEPRRPTSMALAMGLLAVLVLFLIAGAVPVQSGVQTVIFRTPLFICLLALLSVALVLCCVRRRFGLRDAGFHLAHLGVVAMLIGAGIGYLFGRSADIVLPVSDDYTVSRLPIGEESSIPLDFSVGATKFDVRNYDPEYNLYRPSDAASDEMASPAYQFVRTVRVTAADTIAVDTNRQIGTQMLRDGMGGWKTQYVFDDGWVLQKGRAVARHFEARLRFKDATGPSQSAVLMVNHPVVHRGWRFYLMSYNEEPELNVVLTARRDPGRTVVIAGIYAVIVGIGLLCFRRTRRQHAGT